MSSHTNHWWRAHHGISNDAKLQFLALRTGAKRCEVGWVWVILVDFASQNTPLRGSIYGLDPGEIAIMADLPESTVLTIMDAMKERGMVQADGMLSSWSKRQPQREREPVDATAAERQRRRRAKVKSDQIIQKPVTDVTVSSRVTGRDATVTGLDVPESKDAKIASVTAVTPCHGDVTVPSRDVTEGDRDTIFQIAETKGVNHVPVTPCHAQRRGEKRREEYIREECREGESLSSPKTGDDSLLFELPAEKETHAKKPTRRKANRTTEEIRAALGPIRVTWWEAFWSVYPSHEGTNPAMDAYERRILTRDRAVQAYNGAKRYAALVADKLRIDPGATVKYAQGWINDERYIDNCKPIAPPAPPKPIKIIPLDPMALYKAQIEERRLKAEANGQSEVKAQ